MDQTERLIACMAVIAEAQITAAGMCVANFVRVSYHENPSYYECDFQDVIEQMKGKLAALKRQEDLPNADESV